MNRKGLDTDRTPALRQRGSEKGREGGENERRNGRKGEIFIIVTH